MKTRNGGFHITTDYSNDLFIDLVGNKGLGYNLSDIYLRKYRVKTNPDTFIKYYINENDLEEIKNINKIKKRQVENNTIKRLSRSMRRLVGDYSDIDERYLELLNRIRERVDKDKKFFVKRDYQITTVLDKDEDNNVKIDLNTIYSGSKVYDYFIVENDNNDFYIPSSGSCLYKCLKYLGKDIQKTKIIYDEGSSINKYIKTYSEENIPNIFLIEKKKEGGCRLLNIHKNIDTEQNILLIHINNSLYHSIVLKKQPKEYRLSDFNLDKYFTLTPKIETDTYKLKIDSPKKVEKIVVSYDVETYITPNPDKEDSNLLIPIGLNYNIVDLINEKITNGRLIEKNKNNIKYVGELHDMFIEDLYKYFITDNNENNRKRTIQVFSHFGGRFDNFFVKLCRLKDLRYQKIISKGSNTKMLKVSYKELTLLFKDSYNFSLTSLENIGESLNVKHPKYKGIDIKNKSFEWYKEERVLKIEEGVELTWKHYLERDTLCLSEVLINLEKCYKQFDLSITMCSTLSGLSWTLINKTCYGMEDLTVPRSCSLKDLYIKSIYGGRVIHWKKVFKSVNENEYCICIDGNSLYPTVMFSSGFPIGSPIIIKENTSFNEIITKPHFIIDCYITPSNTKYPLHPYRDEDGQLIYKVEPFRGVYNDVDIREMIKDGYKINKIYRGVYFNESKKIYTHIVRDLYELRKKYKSENNYLQYVVKIFLNNFYGYHLYRNDKTIYYKERNNILQQLNSFIEYPNGTKEYHYKNFYDYIDKPIHIGSYVLSYSRKIMNEVIREIGPKHIYYGDTDSLVVHIDGLKNFKMFNEELGGFKNDLGDNCKITEMTILDRKKYLLKVYDEEKNKEYGKCKYSGICFKDIKELNTKPVLNKITIEEYYRLKEKIYDKQINKVDTTFTLEQFCRYYTTISIDKVEITYDVDCNKSDWIDNDSIPFGYDYNKKEYLLTKQGYNHIIEGNKVNLSIGTYEDSEKTPKLKTLLLFPKKDNYITKTNSITNYCLYDNNKICFIYPFYKYKEKKRIKMYKLFLYSKYGYKNDIFYILDEESFKEKTFYISRIHESMTLLNYNDIEKKDF